MKRSARLMRQGAGHHILWLVQRSVQVHSLLRDKGGVVLTLHAIETDSHGI